MVSLSFNQILTGPAQAYSQLSAKRVFWSVIGFDLIVVLLTVYLEMTTPLQFFKEGYPMTWLSAFHLGLCGWTSWLAFKVRLPEAAKQNWKYWLKNRSNPSYIWLIMAIGFLFLAVDELVMLHELMDLVIHWVFQIQESPLTDRLDDFIVLGYGAVAVATLFMYWAEVKQYRIALPFLIMAMTCVFLMVLFDAITNQNDIVPLIFGGDSDKIYNNFKLFEEGLKIWAEGFFLLAFFFSYKKALTFSKTTEPTE